MNVHPELISHWKYRLFKQELGTPDALEYLLCLWGKCQTMKRGENWGRVGPEYVEATLNWTGPPGKLFDALAKRYCDKAGWLHLDKRRNVIVTGWEEHNKSLLNRWENGAKGGRPASKPAANLQVNRRITGTKPAANLPQTSTGLDLTGDDVRGSTADSARAPFPEAVIPSVEEIIAHGAGPAGIPPEFCRHYHTQKQIKKTWTNGRGVAVDWKLEVLSWWQKDRHTWQSKNPPGAGHDVDQLQAQLDTERDPAKRRELREKIRKAQVPA
jgi:hypothetical protein